jgi:flagella basal body P-ring formation protein FlgA
MTTRGVCIVACCLGLLFGASQAEARVIDIDGPRLRLSDLLGAVSQDADLGAAPRPGALRRVPRGRLMAYLSKGVRRRLRRFYTVRTRSQSLGCAKLRGLLVRSLAGKLQAGLKVTSVDCRAALTLPRGPLTFHASLTGRRRAGRLYASVRLRAGSWPERQLTVPVTVDGMIDVVVLARDVRARQRLTSTDLRVVKRRASVVRDDTLSSVVEARQWEPRGTLKAGAVLSKAQLKPVPVVRRGARVTVIVRLPGIRLSSSGQVRQDAGRGQTVAVLCNKTRKLLRARVIGPTRVVVDL